MLVGICAASSPCSYNDTAAAAAGCVCCLSNFPCHRLHQGVVLELQLKRLKKKQEEEDAAISAVMEANASVMRKAAAADAYSRDSARRAVIRWLRGPMGPPQLQTEEQVRRNEVSE